MTAQDRAIEKALKRVKTPLTGIRAFCITCMGGYTAEIETCTAIKCPLYAFRTGRNTLSRHPGGKFRKIAPSFQNAIQSVVPEHSSDSQQTIQRAA